MKRHRPTGRKDYPTSLQGGEGRDVPEHRIGETERQSPQIDKPDPASAAPQPESEGFERPHYRGDSDETT
jgi:hypothetical protein